MKKAYIIMMGLLACICLTTQSCANGDDDDINQFAQDSFSFIGMQGSHPGYWMVFGTKADNCVMTYDGKVLSFSKMPIQTIMTFSNYYRQNGYFPENGHLVNDGSSSFEDLDGDIQLVAGPMEVVPVVVGYSGNNLYFNSSIQNMNTNNPESYYQKFDTDMFYSFSIKEGNQTTYYSLVFDRDTYGVYNAEQKSRVLKIFIKEISIIRPGQERQETYATLKPMMELTFVSND